VKRLIDEAYERAKAIITAHREKLERLSQRLIEEETIESEELKVILER
jgi:cell division protease FtsH